MNKFITILFTLLSFNATMAQQFLSETIMHDGETREYSIYIPPHYQSTTKIPLLFNFHGGGGNIADQIAIADMRSIADTATFILVYPQALPDPSDGGSPNWLRKDPTEIDDVFFVDALIDSISAQYAIDENRIYACGYSLGGEFAYDLACRLNHRIAAVGAVARTMNTTIFDNCAPSHPTGILTILGTEDFVSPYDGVIWGGIKWYLSADEVHEYWATHNNAPTTPMITELPNLSISDGSTVERHTWEEGDECVSIEHLKVIGGGHDWPGSFGNMDIDASTEIWNYVSQYSLLGLRNCLVSTSEGFKNNEMQVFPNPTHSVLNVQFESVQKIDFQLLNLTGQAVLTGNINSNSHQIDVFHLPEGVYFLKVGNVARKVLKVE